MRDLLRVGYTQMRMLGIKWQCRVLLRLLTKPEAVIVKSMRKEPVMKKMIVIWIVSLGLILPLLSGCGSDQNMGSRMNFDGVLAYSDSNGVSFGSEEFFAEDETVQDGGMRAALSVVGLERNSCEVSGCEGNPTGCSIVCERGKPVCFCLGGAQCACEGG